ncbi:MAG: hypothetical protein J6R67_03800 [Treponema sp.]|nr:hypothetical protein [Treponema sp.]
MKKTKVLLAGALVLALGLVMGCGKAMDESVEEHKEGASKFEHVWKAEYKDNSNYIRSAKQFGTGDDELKHVDVTVKMDYPQYGKSGFIFGLTKTEEKDINNKSIAKYNYYIVGLGEDPAKKDGSLQYYIDYCTNMTSLSGGNTADATIDTTTGAKAETVKALTSIEDVSHAANEPVEYTVSVDFVEANGADGKVDKAKGTYTVKIKIGDKIITETINHETYGYVDGKATYPGKGTIASYGMLSGLNKDKKVNTTWTVDKKTLEGAGVEGLGLSAE